MERIFPKLWRTKGREYFFFKKKKGSHLAPAFKSLKLSNFGCSNASNYELSLLLSAPGSQGREVGGLFVGLGQTEEGGGGSGGGGVGGGAAEAMRGRRGKVEVVDVSVFVFGREGEGAGVMLLLVLVGRAQTEGGEE